MNSFWTLRTFTDFSDEPRAGDAGDFVSTSPLTDEQPLDFMDFYGPFGHSQGRTAPSWLQLDSDFLDQPLSGMCFHVPCHRIAPFKRQARGFAQVRGVRRHRTVRQFLSERSVKVRFSPKVVRQLTECVNAQSVPHQDPIGQQSRPVQSITKGRRSTVVKASRA